MSVTRLPQIVGKQAKPTRRELERRLRAMDQALQRTLARLSTVEELAFTDPLTGAFNRRAFEARLVEELSRARRAAGGAVGVLAIDLNDFKRVNDTLGHQAGDELLKRVAEHLKATLRAHDVVCRTGGDEFVVILPGAGRAECAAAVSRIVHGLGRLAHHGPPVSLAVGAAAFPEDAPTHEALLAQADAAMYADKRRHQTGAELRVVA